MVEIQLGHDPLKTGASHSGCRRQGLIVIDDNDPRCWPAPSLREVAEAALDFSGLLVVDDLILARLANIHDRQSLKMPRLDLAGPSRRCRRIHDGSSRLGMPKSCTGDRHQVRRAA